MLVNHGDSTDIANFRRLRNRDDELLIDRSAISDDLDSRVESTLATRSCKLQHHEPKQVGSTMLKSNWLHPTEIPTSHAVRNKHLTPSP